METRNKTFRQFNKFEKRALLKKLLPSFILAFSLFTIISVVNSVFQFRDFLTGIEGAEKLPIGRFLIIESVSLILSVFTFLYLTKAVRKDLSLKEKTIENLVVTRKFKQNGNGKIDFKIRLKNNLIVVVDSALFNSISEGELVEVEYVHNCGHVFHLQSAT